MVKDIEFIVEKLNAPPFEKGLTLVTFDSKSPKELLSIVNDVMVYLDPKTHPASLRDENIEVTMNRMLGFLRLLKLKVPGGNIEIFSNNLMNGDRNACYPILTWVLQRLPAFKKRSYVARYLGGMEIPMEYLSDPALSDIQNHMKALQNEFKEVHKAVDKLDLDAVAPKDLKREIAQLQDEKTQLKEKIESLKRRTSSIDEFKNMLDVTSALRSEQEEESKIMDRIHDQRAALSTAETRLASVKRLKQELDITSSSSSPIELVKRLEAECRENQRRARSDMPEQIAIRRERLTKLKEMLMEPSKTESDIERIQTEVSTQRRMNEALNEQIMKAQSAMGDDKLAVYRQQSALLVKKIHDKEAELEQFHSVSERLNADLEEKESKMSEISGSKFMKRDEFKNYANQLRNKTNNYKQLKQLLADLTSETVVLSRSEQILRGRVTNMDEFISKQEAKKGVKGFSDTQATLESISAAKAETDLMKGKTLDEISAIVDNINSALLERKNQLAPQIKQLRSVRQEYQEIEIEYLEKRAIYENTAVGLDSERLRLESEADVLQEECLREESRYHFLQSLFGIANARLDRVQREDRCEKGEETLLRDFKTYKDLYSHKITQQQNFSDALRKRHKSIKENEAPRMEQRAMFENLQKILQCKNQLYKDEYSETKDDTATIDNIDFGGADVMMVSRNM